MTTERLRELADNVADALRTALALGHFSQTEEIEARAAVDEYDAFILSNDSSDTPETDALALSVSRTDHNWRQLCRKLERERDEFAEKWAKLSRSSLNAVLRLERERDEAREEIENLRASSIHTCHDQCQRPMCVLRRDLILAKREAK